MAPRGSGPVNDTNSVMIDYDDRQEPSKPPTIPYAVNREEIEDKRECSICRCLVRFIVTIVVVAAITVGVLFYFGKPKGTPKFLASEPPGLNATNQWERSTRTGLDLTVENAMEDKYTSAFEEMITRWDNGSPDALTLSTARVTPEVDCDPSLGKLKICSGDYGNTDWRGINFNFVSNNFIVYSTSKLNNYHLDNENNYQRRYTVCHELGHGFGLPHTDENYWNPDRGDCMDYTIRPERNLDPGTYNYDLLQQLYGSVVTRSRRKLRGKGKKIPNSHRELSEEMKVIHARTVKDMEGSACAESVCIIHLGNGMHMEAHKLRV